MADSRQSGLVGALHQLLRTVTAVVQNRFELLVVELEEERFRLINALLLLGVILVFALLTLIMLIFTVLLAVGDGHRLVAAAIITFVFLVITLSSGWRLREMLKHWSSFSATRTELQKDKAWLEGKNPDS